jgi:hypothetical protein
MPWSSADLPVLDPSPARWPLGFAARLLGPPDLTGRQLRDRVREAGIKPVGKARFGAGKRHVPLFDVAELIGLYASLPVG